MKNIKFLTGTGPESEDPIMLDLIRKELARRVDQEITKTILGDVAPFRFPGPKGNPDSPWNYYKGVPPGTFTSRHLTEAQHIAERASGPRPLFPIGACSLECGHGAYWGLIEASREMAPASGLSMMHLGGAPQTLHGLPLREDTDIHPRLVRVLDADGALIKEIWMPAQHPLALKNSPAV